MSWNGNAVYWRGRASYQHPIDLIRYQELIAERRPEWVIETGSGEGGTTTFLRDVCALINHGFVVGIGDNSLRNVPSREGSVMVILDSDVYSQEHMSAEIEAYAPLVTQGQVLVVCHTDRSDWGSAPALEKFLRRDDRFEMLEAPDGSLSTYLERT